MIRVECVAELDRAVNLLRLLNALIDEGFDARPALLESVLRNNRFARWSVLAVDPFATLTATGNRVTETRGGHRREYNSPPLQTLQSLLNDFRVEPNGNAVAPFRSGAVGTLSYDLGRQIEPKALRAPTSTDEPDIDLAFYNSVVAVDHQKRRTFFFRADIPHAPRPTWLDRAIELATQQDEATSPAFEPTPREARSNMTRELYMKAVGSAQEYIAAGDIYQANVTQRFETAWPESSLALYERLRRVNPAPFAAYIDAGGRAVLSSSPERFLQFDASTRRIETRPIKGTRPVGASPTEERRYARELTASEKEAAELVMIVDMERNDLGRVCEYGSVRVPELRAVERYATVLHTVATVEGVVRQGCSVEDILRATFPGGSITGAPKIRAMQVIDELEPQPRGLYTGAIGYFDLSGSFDLAIAIRTVVVRDGKAQFGVGSGIVADSSPEAEYDETLDKAAGLLSALNATVAGS